MRRLGNGLRRMSELFGVLTDWFLILAGLFLVLTALRAVDVAPARYLLVFAGAVLSIVGLMYRSRRLRRKQPSTGPSPK